MNALIHYTIWYEHTLSVLAMDNKGRVSERIATMDEMVAVREAIGTDGFMFDSIHPFPMHNDWVSAPIKYQQLKYEQIKNKIQSTTFYSSSSL